MPAEKMQAQALIALFEAKGSAPPPESSQMLVRHLQCKASLAISRSVVDAMDRYAGSESQLLPVPTDLLPPLA
jgi:hypothetical protein